MAVKEIGIILNGATGRIGATQHLANALAPIRAEGGLPVGGDRIVPRLLLLGRDRQALAGLAQTYAIEDWSSDLDAALAKPDFAVFFDAAATTHHVFRIRIEDRLRGHDLRSAAVAVDGHFVAAYDYRGRAIAEQPGRYQIGHGEIVVLDRQRAKFDREEQSVTIRVSANVIGRKRNTRRAGYAPQAENRHAGMLRSRAAAY